MKIVIDETLRDKFYVFKDRIDAGKKLAEFLRINIRIRRDFVVLAIPRGGIPIGAVISKLLKIPLGIIVVRKLPIPWEPEAGFGALTSYGEPIVDEVYLANLGIEDELFREIVGKVRTEIKRREALYFRYINPINVDGKIVILVDDGLATGYTMLAAIKSVKNESKKVIVAVPTASLSALKLVSREADAVYCLNARTRIPYFAVADAYRNWRDLTDDDVIKMLKELSTT